MSEEFIYNPVNNNNIKLSLDRVRSNLSKNIHVNLNNKSKNNKSGNSTEHFNNNGQNENVSECTLRLHSFRKDYCLSLLTQFYNDLMIPTFISEDSRDSLEDWVEMLDPQKIDTNSHNQPEGPLMDVIILVAESIETSNKDIQPQQPVIILAGMAFEYYQIAQVGLVSYLTVLPSYRRCGIMNLLHPLGVQALRSLHRHVHHHHHHPQPPQDIKAIFAETSTIQSQEASVKNIRSRHEALYALGYRRLHFPYAQPPLQDHHDAVSVDNLMLLIWCDTLKPYPSTISTEIPYAYVLDFFMSVFGYSSNTTTAATVATHDHGDTHHRNKNPTDAFQHDWYYRLATWYRSEHQVCTIDPTLPWDDIQHQRNYDGKIGYRGPIDENNLAEVSTSPCTDTVVIVGAGMAGLTATLKLANVAAADNRPLKIILVEAKSFVGGRTQTILTESNNKDIVSSNDTNPATSRYDVNSNDKLVEMCRPFRPWPVPIGAEFIHGVGSCLNKLIMEQSQNNGHSNGNYRDWTVEETFDLCDKADYPLNDPFIDSSSRLSVQFLTPKQREEGTVKIFGDGKQWSLSGEEYSLRKEMELGQRYPRLICRAHHLWSELLAVSETLFGNGDDDLSGVLPERAHNPCIIAEDMALSTFVEGKMASESKEDIDTVKSIMDSIFAKTAGTSIDMYGVNEASREDCNWDYTECNFRTGGCFAEIVANLISRINAINYLAETGKGHVQIDLRTDCPIDKVESLDMNPERLKVKLSSTKANASFIANKAIISVPLAILKAKKIRFYGEFALPADKHFAIDKVNMLPGMKAHILLRRRKDILDQVHVMEYTELVFCPGEIFSQVWLRRDETSIFITGFVIADDRDALKCKVSSGHSAKSLFLDQLNRMFVDDVGQSVFVDGENPTCSAFALHDWADDEYTMGAYSSPSVGAGWLKSDSDQFSTETTPAKSCGAETCRHILAKPIKNTIFFAGEHTNIKTCATVQAAIESGNLAAAEVTESLLIH